jgi:UDP-glucose:(heptosyl)LPS alpha-1,3-glucosyltransferase
VVIPKYGLIGGGERFARELTERLARTGKYEFHVFANRWNSSSSEITFHKVPMLRFPRFLRPLGFAWFADRMVAKGNFNLVHAHERIFRADVFSLHSVPHSGWVRDVRRKRLSLFDRVTIRVEKTMMASGRGIFLPVSTLAAEALRREYPVDPAGIRVVHPAVDAERFSSPDREACRSEVRSRHGIKESELLVLFVGMNFEVKGLDAVIAAVAKARRMRPESGIRLLVVGRGDTLTYGKLARRHGIADAVAFAGPISEGVERYYRAADVFAMPSKFDTFGMAVLEAMAAGLPVIVSLNVGAKDVVVEGINGFVVSSGVDDAGPISDAIVKLAAAETRVRMGAEAQRTSLRHTWDRTAEEMGRIYDAVAAESSESKNGCPK